MARILVQACVARRGTSDEAFEWCEEEKEGRVGEDRSMGDARVEVGEKDSMTKPSSSDSSFMLVVEVDVVGEDR